MIGGVSFQPGSQQDATQRPGSSPSQGVQEAIKVLSLRMPKVVGARAMAPGQLLNAQGSGGNPLIDSVVNQVLARYFPTDAPPMTQAPSLGGAPVLGPRPGESSTMPPSPMPSRMPRITPIETGQSPTISPPGVYAPPPAPNAPTGPPVRFDSNPPPKEVFETPASPNPPVEQPGRDAPIDLLDIFRRKYGGGEGF